jgi:hypothetical protein
LNNDFDVIGFSIQRLFEIFRFFPPCDEALQPLPIGSGQGSAGLVPVPLVRINASNDDVIFKHRRGGDIRNGRPACHTTRADACETYDAPRSDIINAFGNDLSNPGALDNDVRFEADVCNVCRVISRTEGLHQIGL